MTPKKTWLVETIKSDQAYELFASGADAAIDALSDSDIASSIPFVGTALKTYQAAQVIRERMLLKKLANFLEHPSQMSPEEKLKFSSQFDDPSKEEEFGEMILVLIEQAEDVGKPKIIGKLLVAHVKGHFDLTTYMRLCKMINRAFTEDLIYLSRMGKVETSRDRDIEHSLYSAGFLSIDSFDLGELSGGMTTNNEIGYTKTTYGKWVSKIGLSEEPIPEFKPPSNLFGFP